MSKGTAVITGAGNGIGQAYAQRLAADGFDIAVADVVEPTATRAMVEAAGRRFFSAVIDVASPASTLQFATDVSAAMAPVTALVNNAGIYPWKSFADTDYETWRKVMGVNLDGTFLMCKAFVPGMTERKRGRIVNVASTTFWLNTPAMTAYIASKGGVIGLGCCRFQRHFVKVFDETGGGLWLREGNSVGSSRLRQSNWSRTAAFQ